MRKGIKIRTGIRAGQPGGGWDINHVKVRTGIRSGQPGGGWDHNHVKLVRAS